MRGQTGGKKIKREAGEEKKKKRRKTMGWQEGSKRAAAVLRISLQDRKV